MTDYRAVTESGTMYTERNGVLHIESERTGLSVFKPAYCCAVDLKNAPRTNDKDFWDWVKSHEYAAVPVVGMSWIAVGFNEWRISRPIVSVEILD